MLEHKSGNISEGVKIEEKLLWRVYRKSPTLFRLFGSPPYFYFRFRLYGHWDGRFCFIFALTAQQSVLDGTNGLSSFKSCAYWRIVHRADIFAIAQLSCLLSNRSHFIPNLQLYVWVLFFSCCWYTEVTSQSSLSEPLDIYKLLCILYMIATPLCRHKRV